MLIEHITSRQNPLVKRAQRVRMGTEPGAMFVEGVRLVEEAFRSEIAIDTLFYTAELASTERGAALLDLVSKTRGRGAVVPEPVMKGICDVENPQGIAAIAVHPRFDIEDALAGAVPLAVVLDAIQDPGNVGAILRAAEAAGATGALTTPGSAEPYGPKALRASMGSAFRLPVARRAKLADIATAATALGIRLVATSSSSTGTEYTSVDWTKPSILLVGNEGSGLSDEALALASLVVTVPLAEAVESLNAAVAAGVILFEAARQRRGAPKTRRGRRSRPGALDEE